MNNFQPKRGDRRTLAAHENDILDTKIMPTARRWMNEYPEGSPMRDHAKQTLEYWGEA